MDINKNKLLITGATGLLGPFLINSFYRDYETYGIYLKNFIRTDKCKLFKQDIFEKELSKLILRIKPDLIIHLAALTDVDLCEKNKKLAKKINVFGTENIVKSAEMVNSKLIYVSTDYVFDGKKGNYSEDDTVNPINYYGKSKYMGEKVIMDLNSDYLVVRTSLYGWNIQDKLSFGEWVIYKLRNNERINLFSDQINSMIFTGDFADILKIVINKNVKGILNIANKESISRYDFGLKVAEVFNLDKKLINKVKFNDFLNKNTSGAKRPRNVSLNTDKLERLKIKVPTTIESLKNMKKIEKTYKKRFYSL